MFARALMHPLLAVRKVKQHGLGRTVNFVAKQFPDDVRWHVRKVVRLLKIGADPVGFVRRRHYARRMAATSPHRDFFPEVTAFRIAPPGTFPAIDRIIPIAREHYRKFLEHYPGGRMDKSAYSYLLFDLNKPYNGDRRTDIRTLPAFQELALHRPFIEMASIYLGEVPIVGGIDFQVVMPNDTTEGFQRFHIDRVDRRQFKIFIAVDDVDEGNGATIVMPADASERFAAAIKHRFGRIADELVMSDQWRGHIRHCAGPAGTAFFFDTCRTVHCGARTRTRPRLLIMLQYISKFAEVETHGNLGKIVIDKSRLGDDPVDRLVTEALADT